MQSFKVVDDKSKRVLFDSEDSPDVDVWEFAYKKIKEHPEYDVFIEVYTDGVFDYWIDSESIVVDYERRLND